MCNMFYTSALVCYFMDRSNKQKFSTKSAIFRLEYIYTFSRMGEVNSPFFFWKIFRRVTSKTDVDKKNIFWYNKIIKRKGKNKMNAHEARVLVKQVREKEEKELQERANEIRTLIDEVVKEEATKGSQHVTVKIPADVAEVVLNSLVSDDFNYVNSGTEKYKISW